ncbi:MAG: hypothetical protein AAFU78_08205 [Cyanobacteria bacterium J06633_2]
MDLSESNRAGPGLWIRLIETILSRGGRSPPWRKDDILLRG